MRGARVLVVSHTAIVGGAERSLLRFLAVRPADLALAVATPEGALADAVRALGLPVHVLRGTSGSLRLDPVETPRALAEMATMSLQVARAARAHRAELVHANTIRAGLVAVGARAFGAPPCVTHVRDVLPPTLPARVVKLVVRTGSRRSLAISGHVARRWAGNAGPDVPVVGELVDCADFVPRPQGPARAALGLPSRAPVAAVVAQITPWKGQEVAIRALAAARDEHPDALLLVVGKTAFVARATRFDNRSYERRLHELATELGVADAVRFLGAVEDVPGVLAATDVVLAPSWDEPFGLAVIEAMAMERTVLATSVGGPAEVIGDGIDGHLIDPFDVAAWGLMLSATFSEEGERRRLGASARASVLEAHTPARYAERMRAAYAGAAA